MLQQAHFGDCNRAVNLLLLRPADFAADGLVRLSGRRLLHARSVLRAAAGDVLRVGLLGGLTGAGVVERLSAEELVLRVDLRDPPPARPLIDLILAMPRPKALRKILPAVASLGVDRIALVNAARVEKSYFDSHVLPQADELFAEGLEQSRDTIMPTMSVHPLFRPFVEDELDSMFPGSTRLVAHPAASFWGTKRSGRTCLAIGPEGGWVPFEIALLEKLGFVAFSLGPRPLRTEVAVSFALGALSR
jgi:16S rRNA (uracil1498-N3)-methyltransferase